MQNIDTMKMRRIQESATAQHDAENAASMGFDPYSTAVLKPPAPATAATPAAAPKSSRRTLDDMRRLSEEIKRNRQPK